MDFFDFIALAALNRGSSGSDGRSGADCNIRLIESMDENNIVNLRDLESGTYILYGYFKPFSGSPDTVSYDNALVSVARLNAGSHVMVFTPLNFKFYCEEILVDSSNSYGFTYTRVVASMLNMAKMGDPDELQTTDTTSVVAAINELKSRLDSLVGG